MTAGAPDNWFEDVYAASDHAGTGVPWARMAPGEELVAWLDGHGSDDEDRSAIVVGCGLGDDAEELARRCYRVVAFDVAPSAIDLCRQRFPHTRVDYRVAELFAPPADWRGAFDLVCEHRTVQSLPPDWQDRGMAAVAWLARPGGTVLVVADLRPEGAPREGPPWRLRPQELAGFVTAGLRQVSYAEVPVAGSGGRTRATIHYERPEGPPP